MPVAVDAKLSAGSALRFGGDGGIFGESVTLPVRGGSYGWTIDTSMSAAGQAWWYALPAAATPTQAVSVGPAVIWPLVVTKPVTLTGAYLQVSTGATGAFISNTLYAASPVTALPAARIVDWFRIPAASAAFAAATNISTTTVLSAYTLYWVASYTFGTATPSIYARSGTNNMVAALPRSAFPTVSGSYSTAPMSLNETTATWNTASIGPVSPVTSWVATATWVPHYWFQFTNV